jgi:hypothetical protein
MSSLRLLRPRLAEQKQGVWIDGVLDQTYGPVMKSGKDSLVASTHHVRISLCLSRALLSWALVLQSGGLRSDAQDWVTTSAPQAQWMSIASSADGRKLIAANEEGGVLTSTNGGTDWTPSPAPYVGRLASSADGTKLILAPSNRGLFYLSTNSGATWIPSLVPTNIWLSVASSADGTKLIAVGWGGVLSSTDSGVTWANYYSNLLFLYVASSADGTKLSAIVKIGAGPSGAVVHTSTNSGATWSPTGLALDNPFGLTCSADGNKLAATHWEFTFGGPNAIFVSPDFGATWTRTSAPTNNAYKGIASSADGTTLVAPPMRFGSPPIREPLGTRSGQGVDADGHLRCRPTARGS